MPENNGTTFEEDGIAHLLKDLRFQVPAHQRSYKWERLEHVQQLFRDISDAMNDPDADTYFLGMIVLKRGASHEDRHEVIDGQQRLATVSIFLAAVREYFFEHDEKERGDDIQRDYLATRHTRTRILEPRLYLNTEDKKFFQDNVIDRLRVPAFKRKDHPKDSHRRIADAIAEANEQVARIADSGSPEKAVDRLLDWVEFLLEKARVVAISVPSEQNAYTLFETLNDRGLELTKADLIKNHLFGRAGSSTKLDEIRQFWTEMSAHLDSEEGTVDYIRHFWSSRYEFVRTKQLYVKVKQKTYTARAACDTASELCEDAKLYSALSNSDADLWKDYGASAREHARTLNAIGVTVIKPLSLSVLRCFAPKEIATAFHLFVNWSVRLLIVGGHRSENVERPLAECAIKVANGKILTANAMAKDMGPHLPTDDDFRIAFSIATAKGRVARYFLRAIEDYLAKEPHPEWIAQPDAEKVDLEHVLPQRPSKDWKFSQEEIDSLYARIGNLAILPKALNLKLGNKSFPQKKKTYKDSSFTFTKWITKQPDWTAARIEKRQLLLAEEAVKTWPLHA